MYILLDTLRGRKVQEVGRYCSEGLIPGDHMMRRTKIVATIGPSSYDREVLKEMIEAGMNVARQNFSHGTLQEHEEVLETLRSLSSDIAVMMDTQGPEVRLGTVAEGTFLKEGNEVILAPGDFTGDLHRLPVDHPEMFVHLAPGDYVLLDDGELELEVEEVGKKVSCRVIHGGQILSKKSVNVPGKDLGLSTPTDKDISDIKQGAKLGFDFLSASFVKSAADVETIKGLLEDEDSDMDVIAKVEHLKAIQNIDEILDAADGIMIARGDLGVEVPASDVPILQKEIIEKCNKREKPVITATQMLKSMTEKPRATRAEVSDVANAVIDGSDAVMLSEETAVGKYPVKSIRFMSEVIMRTEEHLMGRVHHTVQQTSVDVSDIIAKNVWQAARNLDARYIIAHTSSGYTAKKIAKLRPDIDIIVFTDSDEVKRKLSLVWGIKAFHCEFLEHVDETICESVNHLYQEALVEIEDTLILTAGVPALVSGVTNMMEIRTVKSLLEERKGILY